MTENTKNYQKKEAFRLEPVLRGTGRRDRLAAGVTDTCFGWLYLAGLTVWLFYVLQMPGSLGVYLAAGLFAALLYEVVFELLPVKKVFCLPGWLGVLTLAAVLSGKVWISGLHEVCNLVISAIGRHFPYMLPAYAVTVGEDMQTMALYVAMVWLLLLLVLPGGFFVRHSNRFLLGVQVVLLLVFQIVLGTTDSLWALAFAVFCLLAVWIREHAEKVSAGVQQVAVLETVFLSAVVAVILLAGVAALAARFLPQNDQNQTVFATWKQTLEQKVENYRYQGESHILPEGNFKGLTSFEPNQTTVLNVTMSQPQSCYLRGFTGVTYTDTGWTGLDAEKLWASRDLFYWLHQDGFYGQEILGDAAKVLGDAADTQQVSTISIENVNGSSKYIYTPYELTQTADDTLRKAMDDQKIGDCALLADGLKGQRSYSYQSYQELVTKYPSYTAALLDTDNLSEAAKAYQTQEEYYNAFAYENYLDVPERLQRELHSLLGEPTKKDGEKHTEYAEAKQNILYLLTEAYTDSNKLDSDWDGSDFIYEFLEVTKKGYSVHFASAATMMFRYYGIPARYVEGYLITPEDRDSMTADTPYPLDETHAHAWVEYYQDGVGWLPFETTPSYLNTMNKAEDYQDISGVSSGSSENQQQEQQEEQDEDEQQDEEDKIDWIDVAIVVLLIGIALLVLTMLIFFIWILVQRHKSKMLKKKFASDDLKVAIGALFEYTMNICSAAGLKIRNTSLYRYEKQIGKMFDEETAKRYHHVVDIRQMAVYSEHELTTEQRDEIAAFKDTIWKRIYSNGTLMQKLQLKFIYFL